MKAETLQKRIEMRLTTKTGKIMEKYKEVIDIISNPDCDKWYLTEWRGRGRKRSLSDRMPNAKEGLYLLSIDFETGNDAPRGGREGDYIALTAKGRRQVKEYAMSKKSEP